MGKLAVRPGPHTTAAVQQLLVGLAHVARRLGITRLFALMAPRVHFSLLSKRIPLRPAPGVRLRRDTPEQLRYLLTYFEYFLPEFHRRQLDVHLESLQRTASLEVLRMLTDDQSPVMRRWRNEFRRRRRPFVEAARTILEQGIATGEFRAVDLEAVPSMLIGIVRGGLVGTDRLPRERFAAAMIDLVMHALSARAKPAAAHAA